MKRELTNIQITERPEITKLIESIQAQKSPTHYYSKDKREVCKVWDWDGKSGHYAADLGSSRNTVYCKSVEELAQCVSAHLYPAELCIQHVGGFKVDVKVIDMTVERDEDGNVTALNLNLLTMMPTGTEDTHFNWIRRQSHQVKAEHIVRVKSGFDVERTFTYEANDHVTVWANQADREGYVLAVIDDQALIEYEMPKSGMTAMWIISSDASGEIQKIRNISYAQALKTMGKKRDWIAAMWDAGTVWDGCHLYGWGHHIPFPPKPEAEADAA
jgi:hypothetical protein